MAGCTISTIKFKTKRGRPVSFRGRPGGQEKNGGTCGNKKRKVTPHMRAVGRAGKACAKVGKPGSSRNAACLRKKLA